MLLQLGKKFEEPSLKTFFGEERFDRIKKYYMVNNRELFKSIKSENKYIGELAPYPNKSFAFSFIKPVDFLKPQQLLKAKSMTTKGILFSTSAIPSQFESLLFKFSEIKRKNKQYDEIKEINDRIMEEYKERKKKIKAENKEAKEKNKILEKDWKKTKKDIKKEFEAAIEGMSEEQKNFMPKEPDYPDEPEYIKMQTEPPEPNLRELPRAVSIHIGENQLNKVYGFAWKILSSFEYYLIEGTNYGILVRREEDLHYSYESLDKITLHKTMTKEEFLKFFDENEANLSPLDNFRPSIEFNPDFIDLISETESFFSSKEWIYNVNEVDDEEEKQLPALATIKPMHAASILSSGMKFSKEIKTSEGVLLIKSAPVKVFTEKVKIINGKKITEIYQQNETKLAFYNLDTRSLEVY